MRRDQAEMIAVMCRLELTSMGIELRIFHNYDEIVSLFEALEKNPSSAANPNRLLLTQTNSFWVFGFEAGEPILGFSVRLDDLGDEDAHSFLPRSIQTIFDVKVVGCTSDIYVDKSWGRAAYFGDLKTRTRGGLASKGKKVVQLATAYAHYRAFNDFGSDTHYCFLRGSDVRNGVPYGFLEADPFVWNTEGSLYADGNPEWVMQLSKTRLPSLMTAVGNLLPERLTIDDKPRLEIVPKNSTGSS